MSISFDLELVIGNIVTCDAVLGNVYQSYDST